MTFLGPPVASPSNTKTKKNGVAPFAKIARHAQQEMALAKHETLHSAGRLATTRGNAKTANAHYLQDNVEISGFCGQFPTRLFATMLY